MNPEMWVLSPSTSQAPPLRVTLSCWADLQSSSKDNEDCLSQLQSSVVTLQQIKARYPRQHRVRVFAPIWRLLYTQ